MFNNIVVTQLDVVLQDRMFWQKKVLFVYNTFKGRATSAHFNPVLIMLIENFS